LPFTLTESSSGDVVVVPAAQSQNLAIADATETAWFGTWLLDQLEGLNIAARGAWNFVAHPAAGTLIAAARSRPASLMRAEQSNSSLRFGDVLMVKLFRRLQPGPNPDEEVLRALADAGFERVPRYIGSVFWCTEGETFAVAVIQEFVPNIGDGWTWILQRLEGVATGILDPEDDGYHAERLLGQRTGELHDALGRLQDPGFEPQETDHGAIEADVRRTRTAIDETIGLLVQRQSHLPDKIRTQMPEMIDALRSLSDQTDGYGQEARSLRIRVHGDYHLGQTLRTLDGDWTILDFEGEPARSLAERRQRTSALKDVAGMLRSFAYARGAAERVANVAGDDAVSSRLREWEVRARQAFLEGYRQVLGVTALPLVPDSDDAFTRALTAWELDKALYEVAYEARNRPDWIELPLRALLPQFFAQPTDARGT
jgi:maltose alpha-D-glucosyltransferase/alpha-amylase